MAHGEVEDIALKAGQDGTGAGRWARALRWFDNHERPLRRGGPRRRPRCTLERWQWLSRLEAGESVTVCFIRRHCGLDKGVQTAEFADPDRGNRARSSSAIPTSLIVCHHLSPGPIVPLTLGKMRTTARRKSRDVVGSYIMYHWILRSPPPAASAWCGAHVAAFAGGFYRAVVLVGILLHTAVAPGDRPADVEPGSG